MAGWLDATTVLWVFSLAFASDLVRAIFEVGVNFRYRRREPPAIPLGQSEVAVVIPCHNSASSIESTIESPVYEGHR